MLYELFAVSLAMFLCAAEEHLTCLRTDDIINRPPSTGQTVTQGKPGKRGPRGLKGEPGVGLKGEPGIPDNSLINSLRGNLFFNPLHENCVM